MVGSAACGPDYMSSSGSDRTTASVLDLALGVLDFVLGCHHSHLSHVFTIHGHTHRMCADCGRKLSYSWETMSIERPHKEVSREKSKLTLAARQCAARGAR